MHVGQEVKCAIQDFESIKNQIEEGYGFVPLSKKHLTKDPFESALEHVKLGSTYACQFLEYNDNYHGFLLSLNINGEMTGDDLIVVVRPKDTGSLGQVKAGLKTEAKITRIDDQSRIIFASVKAAETDNKDTLLKEYESNNKQSTATLGSIISNKK
jgi:ribosomal protein S1